MKRFTPSQKDEIYNRIADCLNYDYKHATDWEDKHWLQKWFDLDNKDSKELTKLILRNQDNTIRNELLSKSKKIPIPKLGYLYIKQGKLDIQDYLINVLGLKEGEATAEDYKEAIEFAKDRKAARVRHGVKSNNSYYIDKKNLGNNNIKWDSYKKED